MVEVAIKAEEFCFLWIPHWSTCMTKAEWASWVQAGVGLVAIYAASKAVRAAHELAMGARQRQELERELRLVEREEQYLGQIAANLNGVAKGLRMGREVNSDNLTRLKNLCKRSQSEDYSSFEVVPLSPILLEAKDSISKALNSLSRIEEGQRRRAKSEFASDIAIAVESATRLEDLVGRISQWRIIYVKGKCP